MSKPVIIINTFKSVTLPEGKKPLVICDIDQTFIKPKFDYNFYYNLMQPKCSDPNELNQLVNNMLHNSINIGLVRQTDKEGFSLMLEKVKELGGKLIFLTARSYLAHLKTINDLIKAGLENPQQFEIHYTGNEITKGDYIQKYNLLNGYNHHIFIDDYPHFLESALRIYPDMNCYLFKYD
jgi:predicted secreted acid phosphatase